MARKRAAESDADEPDTPVSCPLSLRVRPPLLTGDASQPKRARVEPQNGAKAKGKGKASKNARKSTPVVDSADDDSVVEVPPPAEEDDPEPVVAATQTDADFERINAEKVKESIQRTIKRTGVSFDTLLPNQLTSVALGCRSWGNQWRRTGQLYVSQVCIFDSSSPSFSSPFQIPHLQIWPPDQLHYRSERK